MSDAVSGFLAAVIGLAIVAVIVSNRSNSASVIDTAGRSRTSSQLPSAGRPRQPFPRSHQDHQVLRRTR